MVRKFITINKTHSSHKSKYDNQEKSVLGTKKAKNSRKISEKSKFKGHYS